MSQPQPPSDLALWSLHCFCLKARVNPKQVIQLDNNGQVLFQAIGGTTLSDMRRNGVSVSSSQLALLEIFDLIERNGEQVTTRIPALGPDAISAVREAAAKAADHALPGVSEAAREIIAELSTRGLEASAHAVVFGHALDGVLWEVLGQRTSLPNIEPTVDQPFWSGTLWAVYPGVAGSAGTNELTDAKTTLVMVWDDESDASLREFASHPGTPRLLQDVTSETGKISLAAVIDTDIAAPIITREEKAHSISLALAAQVIDAMPDGDQSKALLADAGIDTSAEEAMVIVAHEVIWKVAAFLAETEIIDRPEGPGPGGRVFFRIDP